MFKFLKIVFLTVLLGCAGYVWIRVKDTHKQTIPKPFVFTQHEIEGLEEANQANILIVGDRIGQSYSRQTKEIIEQLSKNLKEPIRVFNWARQNEGIHRTLLKLRQLNKLPELVVYLGGTEEFFEKTFELSDYSKILYNFSKYEDDKVLSLIMTIPLLSRWFYYPVKYQYLGGKINPQITSEDHGLVQKTIEISYKLFKAQFKELLNHFKTQDKKLLIITPPLNLEAVPQSVCSNANSNDILIQLNEIQKLLKENNFKTAYNNANQLAQNTTGNSLAQYYLGKTLINLGRFQEARRALYFAGVYDCSLWRGNIVFNKIIIEETEKLNIPLIDFNGMINANLGKDVLFIDKIYPQEIYWEQLTTKLVSDIKTLLQL